MVETVIRHLHKAENSGLYEKEINLCTLNLSVSLKSNGRKDSLKAMVALAVDTLNSVKDLDTK